MCKIVFSYLFANDSHFSSWTSILLLLSPHPSKISEFANIFKYNFNLYTYYFVLMITITRYIDTSIAEFSRFVGKHRLPGKRKRQAIFSVIDSLVLYWKHYLQLSIIIVVKVLVAQQLNLKQLSTVIYGHGYTTVYSIQ